MEKFDILKLKLHLGSIFGQNKYGLCLTYEGKEIPSLIYPFEKDISYIAFITKLDIMREEIEHKFNENQECHCEHGKNQGD